MDLLELDKPSLPFSQRILTEESIFVTIVTFAWFSWLDALGLWIWILRPPVHLFPFDDLFVGLAVTVALTVALHRGKFRSRQCKLVTFLYIVIANLLLIHGGAAVNVFFLMSYTPIVIVSMLLGVWQGVLYSIVQGALFVLSFAASLKKMPRDWAVQIYGIVFSDILGYIIVAILFGILGLAIRSLEASRREIQEKNEELLRLRLRQERQQIARDVHSSAIQKLYVAQMKAEQATRAAENTDKLLVDIARLVKEAISQLRKLVLERNARQGNDGFVALLETAIKEIDSMADQGAQLEISPSVYQADLVGDISPDTATGALEIAREAVINAVKHAEASQLRVNVAIRDQMLKIVVQDNGKGFPAKNLFAFPLRRNFGLYDMQRRCRELGGKFQISSEPGRGTCVEIALPLSGAPSAQPSPLSTETFGS
ncbi:MAG: ATP-binding protein [Firmicutes bacterium]|nr:ATP-binding protein [Bacillota bacterium]